MKSVGRKPKPAELRAIEGGAGKGGRDLSHRPRKTTPKYPPLTDHPPDELPPLGRALWRRIAQQLKSTEIVQATDREALLVLCDMWATYCTAMEIVRTHGVLIKSKNNNADRAAVIANPAWRVARDAAKQMEGLWASFGLTPADRARLNIGKGADDGESSIASLLTRARE